MNEALPIARETVLEDDDDSDAPRRIRPGRWDRPIEGRFDRFRAWMSMLFADHGILRLAYLNRHEFAPGVWRSAQPSPGQFAMLARRGIKTIVCVRGGRDFGSWPLEVEACKAHGLVLKDFIVYSRALPTRAFLAEAEAFFDALEGPVLFHCKSGADRTGFVAALYLIVKERRPASEALKQLDWRFGHFRFSQTGILDTFFEAFRDRGEAKGLSFETWAQKKYRRKQLSAAFRPHWLASLFADGVLRRE
jgi:protein tyrosine phosphatase (PTP) superfamily phosphohydrolase (DUF442 family)